ncbi:unnamed protein product, partial [Didymodactylos carnosus]
MIVSGKIYIDFPKLGFDVAYRKLITEIQQYRSSQITAAASIVPVIHHHPTVQDKEQNKDENSKQHLIRPYGHCIFTWTEEDVISFLLDKKLHSMLPLCE